MTTPRESIYLTDIVEIARSRGLRCVAVEAPEEDMMGCNTRAELAGIEAVWQARARRQGDAFRRDHG
jgi:bifunctional UDP-N-acetylglucosamine pyrophosphorylase/glucosamine-1-phosphate N-acetyltransferase